MVNLHQPTLPNILNAGSFYKEAQVVFSERGMTCASRPIVFSLVFLTPKKNNICKLLIDKDIFQGGAVPVKPVGRLASLIEERKIKVIKA